MPRPSFRRFTFAIGGSLEAENSTHTHQNIDRWVSCRGGRLVNKMEDMRAVTHLFTTEQEYKKKMKNKHEFLRYALAHKRQVKIIRIDWLEFSTLKGKLLKPADYGFKELDDKQKREQAVMRRELYEHKQRELEERENYVNAIVYRPYEDRTYFKYEITMYRDDEERERLGERYILTLFQSIAKPHTYYVAYKYYRSRRHTQPIYQRESKLPVRWDAAWTQFTTFFLLKTGVEWEDRIVAAWERQQATLANSATNTNDDENDSPPKGGGNATMDRDISGTRRNGAASVKKKKLFLYDPPTGGKSVGAGFRILEEYFDPQPPRPAIAQKRELEQAKVVVEATRKQQPPPPPPPEGYQEGTPGVASEHTCANASQTTSTGGDKTPPPRNEAPKTSHTAIYDRAGHAASLPVDGPQERTPGAPPDELIDDIGEFGRDANVPGPGPGTTATSYKKQNNEEMSGISSGSDTNTDEDDDDDGDIQMPDASPRV